MVACARIGAIAVAVNTRFRSTEIEDILRRCDVSVLVYEPGFKEIDFSAILTKVDQSTIAGLKLIVTIGDHEGADANHMSAIALELDLETDIHTGGAGDGLLVFTTSGTTSKPKFVLHTQCSIVRHARNVAQAFAYSAHDTVLLQALPLCGTFGLSQLLAGLAGGCLSILMPVFDAVHAIDLIRHHNVTSFNGPDGLFAQLIDAAKPGDLASIKWCGFAAFGEADPVEFVRRCDRHGLTLVGLYGMSETQALFARQPLDAPITQRALAGGDLTSLDARAEIRDPESGTVLPPGQSGALYVSGPSQFQEYLDNPDATAAAIGKDGFVRTGDLGYGIETGGFVFETRMGDSLRLSGFLVNPAEIDTWIMELPEIAACQTVGVETKKRLRAVSFVILESGSLDEAAILDHCRSGLAGFKIPVHVFALDQFPVSIGPNGEKIQRGKLRELALQKLTATE